MGFLTHSRFSIWWHLLNMELLEFLSSACGYLNSCSTETSITSSLLGYWQWPLKVECVKPFKEACLRVCFAFRTLPARLPYKKKVMQAGSYLGAGPLLLYVYSYKYENRSKGRKSKLLIYFMQVYAFINVFMGQCVQL